MIVKHKGYILNQNEYDNHYIIIDISASRMCCHVQYDKKLTKEEAKEAIERFLEIRRLI